MKKNINGFTIIEVALVLAIAGLIFAMTFAILPNLMANERDSERRDDMITFISNLKNYQQNNSRGNLPGQTSQELADLESNKRIYVKGDDVVKDKDGELHPSFAENSWGGFMRDYFTSAFEDPSGYAYNLEIMNCEDSAHTIGYSDLCNAPGLEDDLGLNSDEKKSFDMRNPDPTIFVLVGASCDASDPIKAASKRKIAVVYRLENSGNYCYTN